MIAIIEDQKYFVLVGYYKFEVRLSIKMRSYPIWRFLPHNGVIFIIFHGKSVSLELEIKLHFGWMGSMTPIISTYALVSHTERGWETLT